MRNYMIAFVLCGSMIGCKTSSGFQGKKEKGEKDVGLAEPLPVEPDPGTAKGTCDDGSAPVGTVNGKCLITATGTKDNAGEYVKIIVENGISYCYYKVTCTYSASVDPSGASCTSSGTTNGTGACTAPASTTKSGRFKCTTGNCNNNCVIDNLVKNKTYKICGSYPTSVSTIINCCAAVTGTTPTAGDPNRTPIDTTQYDELNL